MPKLNNFILSAASSLRGLRVLVRTIGSIRRRKAKELKGRVRSIAQINGKWKFLELLLCSVQEVFLQGSVQKAGWKRENGLIVRQGRSITQTVRYLYN